jgi:hypothetical protein
VDLGDDEVGGDYPAVRLPPGAEAAPHGRRPNVGYGIGGILILILVILAIIYFARRV